MKTRMFFNVVNLIGLIVLCNQLCIAQTIYGGLQIPYDPCSPCSGNVSYGNTAYFNLPQQVASDFGPRYLKRSKPYDWHGGIDYSIIPNDQNADKGAHLRAIVGGTVYSIGGGSGIKWIIIDSVDHDFGYLHIFEGGSVFPMDVGDCSMVKLTNSTQIGILIPQANSYRLLAVCPNNNCNGLSYKIPGTNTIVNATNQVARGDIIGVLGDSGAAGAAHLHLNRYESLTSCSGAFGTCDEYMLNPLEHIEHTGVNYTCAFHHQSNGVTDPDNELINFKTEHLIYPGTKSSPILFRPKLLNGGNNNTYTNATFTSRDIGIEIRKKSAGNNFLPLEGNNYISKIVMGGTDAHPNDYPPDLNLSLVSSRGSWLQQGIYNFTYSDLHRPHGGTYTSSDARPFDDFYFPFFTRIHKDSPLNGAAIKFAHTPIDVRYPDDEYTLKARITDIRGGINAKETEIKLDNFMPFISDINIEYNNSSNSSQTYLKLKRNQTEAVKATTDTNGNSINKDIGNISNTISNNGIDDVINPNNFSLKVVVRTTEAVKNFSAKFRNSPTSPFVEVSNIQNIDQTLFFLNLENLEFDEFTKSLQFKGIDASGNELINVYSETGKNNVIKFAEIPVREGLLNTDWSIIPQKNNDQIDFKLISCPKRRSSTSSSNQCEPLSAIEAKVTYLSCEEGKIEIIGTDFNPANYAITWSDNEGNILTDNHNEISIVKSGTYCYKVEAIEDCCSTEGCVEVSQEEMDNTIGIWPQIIYQNCNPEVEVNTIISNLSWPYYFKWENGSTEHFITVTQPGTYCLTVTGNNGCSNTACFEVEDRILKVSGNPDPICPNETGYISPIITGGTEPYIFQWSNGETTQDIFDLQVGTYYLLVEDANGCWITEEFDIKLNDKIVEVSHFENLQNCDVPDGKIIIKNLLDEDIIYQWYDSYGVLISTNKDITNLKAGEYTLVAKSNSGCTTELKKSICCCKPGINTGDPGACYIGYNKDLVVTGTVTHTSNGENNGSVFLVVQGGKGQYIFTWTGPDGYSSSEIDIKNLAQGEYAVTVTDGCATITKTFIINDGLICKSNNINIEAKTTCILAGVTPGKIDITVSGGKKPYSYQWTTDGSTAQDYSSFYGGSSVIVTDQNGCTANKFIDLPNGNKLITNFLITNPDPCNEYVDDVLATIKIISGNPPYNVRISNNVSFNKVFTFNEEVFSVRLPAYNDGGLWNYVIYYLEVSDGCNFSVNESQTISCDKLCPERCLQVSVTNTGPGGCIDVDENVGLSGASKFKYESFCSDGMKREIYNETKNEGFVFETKASHEGQELYEFNLAIYDIFLRNYTTGCVIHERIDASDRCWNLWNWLGSFMGGPPSNTSSSNPCPKYKNVLTPKNLHQNSNFHVDVSSEKEQEIEFEVSFNGNYLFSFYHNIGSSNTSIDYDFNNQLLGDYIIKVHSPFADCKKEFKFKIENVVKPIQPNCNNNIINLYFDSTSNYFLSFERSNKIGNKNLVTNLISKKLHYNSIIDSNIVIDGINNVNKVFIDNVYNIYSTSCGQSGGCILQKMDIKNNIIWMLPLHIEINNIFIDSIGNFILLGYDEMDSKWIAQSISTEKLFGNEIALPLQSILFAKVILSGNTTVALDSISNKMVFATTGSSIEKPVPQGVIIKDIKTLENGNILAAGEFNGLISVGGISYNSDEFDNAIFITYDKVGNILASQSVQNYRDETVQGIATKGNEQVAYHGRYKEIVYYAPNPADNVIDSCIFVNIISLTDTACTLLSPVLTLDETSCKLTLSSPEPDVIYTFHEEVDGVWEEVNGAAFPYQPEANGRYRASAKKEGCTTAFSDVIEVNCLKIPLPCDITLLDLTYDTLKGIFTVYWGETAGGVDSIFGNNIDKTLITSTITTFVKYQISYTWVKYIRYDSQGTVYIFGTDGTTKSFVTTVTTSGVTTTTWYQDVILHDIIWRPVLYQYSLLMYDKILNQYTHQIRRLTGQLISTENLGNFQSGKFTFELLQYHKTGYYTNIEYSSAQTSIRWYMGPTIYLTNLPPAVRIKRIQKWSQDRWMVSTEYTGTIIINGTTYTSLGYNTVMFIWYDGQGNVIKVTEIKHSRDEFISHVSTDGIKKVAYTGTYRDTIYNNTYPNGYMIEECAFMDGFDVEFNTPAPIVVPTLSKTDRVPKSSQEFRFYPNPFSKGINLDITSDIAEEVNIETYNMVGALMFTTKLDLQQGQNVRYMDAFERIPAGVYMVKIKSPTREHMTRVIRIE